MIPLIKEKILRLLKADEWMEASCWLRLWADLICSYTYLNEPYSSMARVLTFTIHYLLPV